MSSAIYYDSITQVEPASLLRGDIHIVDFGEGKEHEETGENLCVILQNDMGNIHSNTTIVAVISEKVKNRSTRFDITKECGLDSDLQICLENIRTISKSRIVTSEPLGHIDIDLISDNIIATFGFEGVNSFSNKRMNIVRGGIYYIDLGIGEGSEQSGKRPCIVLQNDVGNWYSQTVLVAPITSQIKRFPTHFLIENHNDVGLDRLSQICFEQIRTVSKKRFLWNKPIGKLDTDKFKDIIFRSFGLNSQEQIFY